MKKQKPTKIQVVLFLIILIASYILFKNWDNIENWISMLVMKPLGQYLTTAFIGAFIPIPEGDEETFRLTEGVNKTIKPAPEVIKTRHKNSFTTWSAAGWRLPLLLKRRRNSMLSGF